MCDKVYVPITWQVSGPTGILYVGGSFSVDLYSIVQTQAMPYVVGEDYVFSFQPNKAKINLSFAFLIF